MDNFYRDLVPFSEFSEIVNLQSYEAVPADWVVALSDIRGSTKAIQEGRYKEVNMAGAASITAILNACKPLDIPFVFGGDGGAVILPGRLARRAGGALAGLRSFASNTLNLDMRVGIIPISRLRRDGTDILVRKFQLSQGNFLAMIAGGGLERADELLKASAGPSSLLPENIDISVAPDLDGLSCRWEPLRPNKDHMIALLVRGIDHKIAGENDLSGILTAIEDKLGRVAGDNSPVNQSSLRFRWPPCGLRLESEMSGSKDGNKRSFPALLRESFFQFLCEKFAIKLGPYDGATYRGEVQTNTDFRKYDDMLRLVLD
ncbi:MAG: DUF3095 domain-containing protein, partial [Fimbriimonadaceae bacterium]|nr:DUF3095 domain-containing protein [Alphaproteobacteria bacterium]